MTLFEGSAVTVRYGAVRALEDIDITLEPGAVHGVIGPNGAGKSTFIDALSGRRRLSAGKVLLDGEDITGRPAGWRRLHGVSRSFQRTSVFPSMTVRDQLEMVARHTGGKDLGDIVDVLALGPFLGRVCNEIAYGTQRSVDLALALVGEPRVVLLDEPCAGLVADEAASMLDHIRGICTDRKAAVLLVEHDVEGVFRICDTITVLNLGTVLASGAPADVRKNEDVVRAYLESAA